MSAAPAPVPAAPESSLTERDGVDCSKFGIYRDRHEGLGHEEADAKQYAEWKCDYVKNDGYGNSTPAYSHGMTATEVYGKVCQRHVFLSPSRFDRFQLGLFDCACRLAEK